MGMIFEWRVRSGSWEHEEGWKMTRRLGTIVSVLVFMHSFQGMEACAQIVDFEKVERDARDP